MAKLSGNKTIGKQRMPEEEHGNMIGTLSQSGGNRTRSTEILIEPMDGQKNIADTLTTSRRSTSLFTDPGIRGTGTKAPSRWRATMRIVKLDQLKARKGFKPTTTILASLRQEHKDDRIPLFRRTNHATVLLDGWEPYTSCNRQ